MNDQNLIPGRFAIDREAAVRAGKKSVEVRRNRKKIKKILSDCLELQAPNAVQEGLKKLYPEIEEDITNNLAMSLQVVLKANEGNLRAFNIIAKIVDKIK